VNRINEITFNSSLIGEYRAIDFVARLIASGSCRVAPDRAISPHQCPPYRARPLRHPFRRFQQLSTDYDFFDMLQRQGKRGRPAFSWTSISTISAWKSTVDLPAEAQAEWA